MNRVFGIVAMENEDGEELRRFQIASELYRIRVKMDGQSSLIFPPV